MPDGCPHERQVQEVKPSARGCEECLKIGSPWLHLRLCRTCGHVGCCDDSPNRHATAHYHATRHPVIEGYDPPEGWGWCYIDEVFLDLSDRATPQWGPIPRYYRAASGLVGEARIPVAATPLGRAVEEVPQRDEIGRAARILARIGRVAGHLAGPEMTDGPIAAGEDVESRDFGAVWKQAEVVA